ncbi:MAG: glycoside hydrolase family 44 protein [Limisphaerales bacterium]
MKTPSLTGRARCVWPCWLLMALTLQLTARADQVIYDDSLENGWMNWGWATINYANTTQPIHSGSDSVSVTITDTSHQAIYIAHSAFDTSSYTNLVFWINGGPTGGQQLLVQGHANGAAMSSTNLPALAAGTWQQFTIPLAILGVANSPNMDGFWIQDRIGAVQPTFYVDDISLQSAPPVQPGTNAPVSITVDAQANRQAISPLIYGVAYASSSGVLLDLNAPLHRSGGNGTTTYNWQNNAWNHAADWYFESIADSPSTAGADGDSFIQESKSGGAQAMLTIPMIGWVAKLGSGRASLASYNTNKYGPQTATDPYWSAAGNGVSLATGLNITTNDPNDANVPADTNFQAGWVQHLTNAWHTATNGGLLYYLMDNEWSIWQSTHRDVHPIGPTMTEVFTNYCNYATMVKGIDPNALVAGPEEWGWPGYLYSGYDQQWASENGYPSVSTYPDRAAHGGWDFGPWFLTQVNLHSQAAGKRLLDVFTLHCYPQENNVSGNAVDSATELLRNQSTRQFWDTNFVDPSWINSVIALIPRMRSWVTTNYPGTKIGITEYNFGAEPYINGATAQADIDGIFGREGLDLATRWTTPDPSTPTYLAMKMYRNYDGNKSTFGDTSVLATVPNPDNLSAFAAIRTNDSALTLMVINKDILNATPLVANITNFANSGTAQAWQLTSADVITRLADVPYANGVLSNTLPSQSITLFILPTAKNLRMRVGTNAPAHQLELWMDGQGGQRYILQSSTNLTAWSAVSTNTFSSNSFRVLVSTTSPARMFYRGVLNSP